MSFVRLIPNSKMLLRGYDDLSLGVKIELDKPFRAWNYSKKVVDTSTGEKVIWIDKEDFRKKFSSFLEGPKLIRKFCEESKSEWEMDEPFKLYSLKTQRLWKLLLKFSCNPPTLQEVDRIANLKVCSGKDPHILDFREKRLGRNLLVTRSGDVYLCMTRVRSCQDRTIGKGATKNLKIGVHRDSLTPYVLATFFKTNNPDYLKEIQILEKCYHIPEIVKLYAVAQTSNKVYLVMEYCEKGSLWDFLKKNALSFEEKKKLALDFARGLAALHKENIIHRDIKAQNLLITEDLRGKICDFGDARLNDSKYGHGTPDFSWDPTQAKDWKAPLSPKADVWALGVSLFLLFHPEHALLPHQQNNMKRFQIIEKLKSYTQKEIDEIIDQSEIEDLNIRKLLKGMLQVTREQRMSAEEVVKSLEDPIKSPVTTSFSDRFNSIFKTSRVFL